nr:hypothetical protein [Tanacetum cinerariifolium]
SSSTSPKSFLEETNTFHNSLPEFENFCFDLEEFSSGSTTTHSDISLPDYEAFSFNDDLIKEISSGSTTTHSDVSLSEYDSFIFDLTHEEFVDELAHIISPPEYDCFYFWNLPDPGELMSVLNSKIRENLSTTCVNLPIEDDYSPLLIYFPPSVRSDFTNEEFANDLAHIISPPDYDCFYFWNLPDPGELMYVLNSGIRENLSSTTRVNLPVKDDYSTLLAYVVWIFLAYLTCPVIPPYLHPFGNEDTIFNPCITINHFYSFKPGLSHRCGAFKKFNTHRSHLNEWPMIINGKNIPILDVLLFHFYPP